MKVIAIEKKIEGANWDNTESLLSEEAQHVFELYLSDTIREIYFTENNNAVVIMETKDKYSANKLLDSFPLVKSGKIKFDVMELRPYKGYRRLMEK